MGIRERLKGLNDNFRGYVIAALRTRPFRVTHLLHSFLKALNDLKVQSVQTNYKALLVWGYYMNRHGYLEKSERPSRKDVSAFFSERNIRRKLSEPCSRDDKDYYFLVIRSIERNYARYENIVYNTVGMNIERLFDIHHGLSRVVDDYVRMSLSKDRRLSDDEMRLVFESWRRFVSERESFLSGTQRW